MTKVFLMIVTPVCFKKIQFRRKFQVIPKRRAFTERPLYAYPLYSDYILGV